MRSVALRTRGRFNRERASDRQEVKVGVEYPFLRRLETLLIPTIQARTRARAAKECRMQNPFRQEISTQNAVGLGSGSGLNGRCYKL